MMFFGMFFYLFAGLTILSAFFVLISRNSVHSALWLIFAFFNAAGLFILLGAEFLAMILVIVYVGAVAVLFLFVVMMIDQKRTSISKGLKRYKGFVLILGVFFASELLIVVGGWKLLPVSYSMGSHPIPKLSAGLSNTHVIGNILYTQYGVLFQIAGFILLVAIIGSIILTQRVRTLKNHKQIVADQLSRTKETSIEVCKIDVGRGI